MGNRRKARECALQLLYDVEFNRLNGVVERNEEQKLEDYWACFSDSESIAEDVRDFSEKLVMGVTENEEDIDKLIQSASTNWKLERMALVDRNILRLATFELKYMDEIPPKVSLNEAIEIAKRFGSEDSSAFINGILDKISNMT